MTNLGTILQSKKLLVTKIITVTIKKKLQYTYKI